MRPFLLILSLVFLSFGSFSQPGTRPGGGQAPTGRFYGKVVEAKSNRPIEYASVQILQNKLDTATKKRVETVVGGMLTKANGEFSIDNVPFVGQSKLKVSIVGYKAFEQTIAARVASSYAVPERISRGARTQILGDIWISPRSRTPPCDEMQPGTAA